MALEDAAVLSRCLEEVDDIAEAFRRYEATRKPRASVVQAGSSANTWMRNDDQPRLALRLRRLDRCRS